LFAVGKNVDNETGRQILGSWNHAGHLIGNHTYSHRTYTSMSFDDFSADVLHGEEFVKPFPRYTGFFRFPALKEGDTAEKRDRIRTFLRDKRFRNGSVTVDASDWYYDRRLRERLKADASFDVARFRRPYLDHLLSRARYYDGLAKQVLGRSPKHTLLVHYNLINVLFLSDAMEHLRQNGWRWVSADDAFKDPVFRSEPKTVPAGESLIWALAKASGRFEGKLRYPGEDGDYEKDTVDRI
ncbi:MAG: polysaccharide deacetylase, partial [Bryobacterales bacterium]|nr:polysaccharide deacetylase [Bryobacterales bacterium]